MAVITDSFCDRFHKAMEVRDMKPSELSDRTGISLPTISQYMSGYSKPKTERTALIATALNVDPAWLMGFDVPMTRAKQISDEDIGNTFANDNVFEIIDNLSALSTQEKNHFTSYLRLLEINRKKADNYVKQLLSIQEMDKALHADAAHARTDIDIPEDTDTSDNDIMNDEDF